MHGIGGNFLLSQAGKVMSCDSMNNLYPNIDRKYKKIVIMFYTGLNDEDGQEVFSGDIAVNAVDCKYIVAEDPLTCGYYLRSDDLIEELPAVEKMKVIGNIYKNPELLRGE